MSNNKFNLSKHGDPIERENISFIDIYIDGYRKIWEKFIGNLGGYPSKVNGLGKDEEEIRYKLAELNYSILLSLLSINRRKEYYTNEKLSSQDSFIIHEDTKIVFSSISSIIDLIEKNHSSLGIYQQKLKDKYEFVGRYMEERNEALHGRKLKTHINNGEVFIPKTLIASKPFLPENNWSEYNEEDYIPLAEYLGKCLEILANLSNNSFHKIYDLLCIKWNNLTFPELDFSQINNEEYSGLTQSKIYTFVPPSFKG